MTDVKTPNKRKSTSNQQNNAMSAKKTKLQTPNKQNNKTPNNKKDTPVKNVANKPQGNKPNQTPKLQKFAGTANVAAATPKTPKANQAAKTPAKAVVAVIDKKLSPAKKNVNNSPNKGKDIQKKTKRQQFYNIVQKVKSDDPNEKKKAIESIKEKLSKLESLAVSSALTKTAKRKVRLLRRLLRIAEGTKSIKTEPKTAAAKKAAQAAKKVVVKKEAESEEDDDDDEEDDDSEEDDSDDEEEDDESEEEEEVKAPAKKPFKQNMKKNGKAGKSKNKK